VLLKPVRIANGSAVDDPAAGEADGAADLTELAIAVGAGFGGMLGWGLADFFAKKTIDQIGDIVSLAWAHVFGSIAFIVIALYQSLVRGQAVAIPTDAATLAFLALFGVLQAAVYLLVYRGFSKGQVALLNPLFASFSGLTAIMSIAAFGEAGSANRMVALAVIFLGILFINVDLGALGSRRIGLARIPGIREIAVATVLAAVWTICWDQFIGGKDSLSCALFMYAFMTVAILVVAMVKRTRLSEVKPECWKYLVLIGICETIAYLAISVGYSQTSLTSVVALLSGAFSLPTIVLARVVLKEKTTRIQTAGTFAIVLGIVLLPL
jgi:drug/metabolite transporter (DMT)-like permease